MSDDAVEEMLDKVVRLLAYISDKARAPHESPAPHMCLRMFVFMACRLAVTLIEVSDCHSCITHECSNLSASRHRQPHNPLWRRAVSRTCLRSSTASG